jgi:hypothetical protein
MNTPVICIGQDAIGVGEAMQHVHHQLLRKSFRALYVDKAFSASLSGKKRIHHLQIARHHSLAKTATLGSESHSAIMDNFRRILEGMESTLDAYIISDMTFPVSEYESILYDIIDTYPLLTTHSVLLSPLSSNAVDHINALRTIQHTLHACQHVQMRGLTECVRYMETEQISSFTLSDLYEMIAADAAMGLVVDPTSETTDDKLLLWPHQVTTPTSKLYDLRTSCWKYLRCQRSKSPYNRLRSLAANLHASSEQAMVTVPTANVAIQKRVTHASLVDIVVHRSSSSVDLNASAISAAEVSAALKWACPSIPWPALGVAQKVSSKYASNPSIDRRSRQSISRLQTSTTAASRKCSQSARSVNTSARNGMGDAPFERGTRKTAPPPDDTIAALSFNNPPFAVSNVHNICNSVGSLIERGAYMHNLDGDKECLLDSLHYTKAMLEG